ncbi:hypothetical protein PENTCL1PPCAC_27773, partial [Pristionchus entomophagus]
LMLSECTKVHHPHTDSQSVIFSEVEGSEDAVRVQLIPPDQLQPSAFKVYCPRPVYPSHTIAYSTPLQSNITYSNPAATPLTTTTSSLFTRIEKNGAPSPLTSFNELLTRIGLAVIQ